MLPEASSTMRALQRALVSVIITLLNDSERSLNKKWLCPVTYKSNPPFVWNQSETHSYLQFKLFHFIYPHKETYIVVPKIESENIACYLTKTHHCFGSHLGFRTIHLSILIASACKHLGERWRSERKHLIALRALALLNTSLSLAHHCLTSTSVTTSVSEFQPIRGGLL